MATTRPTPPTKRASQATRQANKKSVHITSHHNVCLCPLRQHRLLYTSRRQSRLHAVCPFEDMSVLTLGLSVNPSLSTGSKYSAAFRITQTWTDTANYTCIWLRYMGPWRRCGCSEHMPLARMRPRLLQTARGPSREHHLQGLE
jgi:hypothetical protein